MQAPRLCPDTKPRAPGRRSARQQDPHAVAYVVLSRLVSTFPPAAAGDEEPDERYGGGGQGGADARRQDRGPRPRDPDAARGADAELRGEQRARRFGHSRLLLRSSLPACQRTAAAANRRSSDRFCGVLATMLTPSVEPFIASVAGLCRGAGHADAAVSSDVCVADVFLGVGLRGGWWPARQGCLWSDSRSSGGRGSVVH